MRKNSETWFADQISIEERIETMSSWIKIPIIREINSIAHPNAIRLWLGELPFPIDRKILDVVLLDPKPEYFRYCPNAWVIEVRKEIAKNYNSNSDENNVLVTIWVQEAMYISLLTLKELWLNKVLIPEISFWIYSKIPTELWMKISRFKLNPDFSIDIKEFEKTIKEMKPEIIILNSPANPTWYIYSETEIKKIVEILKRNWAPFVISDDIYSKLSFKRDFTSIHDKYENTIVVDWISKSWASAWLRVGWIYSKNKWIIKICSWKSTTIISSPPTLNQYMALPVIKWETETSILSYKDVLEHNFDIVKKYLSTLNVTIQESMWWFYSFPEVSHYTWNDTEEFCRYAAKDEEWVVVIPWKAFWKPKHIRISFASDKIEEWMKRLIKLLQKYNIKTIKDQVTKTIDQLM